MKLLKEDRHELTPEQSHNMRIMGKVMGGIREIEAMHASMVNNNFSQEAVGKCAEEIKDIAHAIINLIDKELDY
jgi:hypothetical protein